MKDAGGHPICGIAWTSGSCKHVCGRPPDHPDVCWCGYCSRPRDKTSIEIGCPRCHTKVPATANPVTACRRCDVELVVVGDHVFVRAELPKGKALLEELDRLAVMAASRRLSDG